jgi:hypothetical protein
MVHESYDEALNGSGGSRKWSAGRVISTRLPGIDVGANLWTDVKSGRGEVSLITMAADTTSTNALWLDCRLAEGDCDWDL